MAETHSLMSEIERLTEVERHILDQFIHGQRVARDITAGPVGLGDRVADRVAAFGGSWRFIFLAVGAIALWLLFNVVAAKAFDPFPFILLNLILSCLAALQAPVIMMSQNRQSAHDRLDAQHDYEVNTKADAREPLHRERLRATARNGEPQVTALKLARRTARAVEIAAPLPCHFL